MSELTQIQTKLLVIATCLAMLCALALPVVSFKKVSAAQLVQRKVTVGTSKVSTSTTFAVSFRPAATTAIEGIVVELCMNSPIIGLACTTTNGVTSSPTNGTVTVSQTGATPSSVNFNVHANSANTGRLILTHATGFTAPVTNADMTFSFTATTPSAVGPYYARILTYTSDTVADDYTSTVPGVHIDNGGVALATANQLTLTARVQEVLQFCVGTTDADSADDCTDISGTTIDLGTVDSSSVTETANDAGMVMVRTNAVNGLTIAYFSEQETASGKLKVAGATCSGTATTDQCFNSAGTTQNSITAGTEEFGMTIENVNTTNGTTTNLSRDTQYDGSGSGGYAWDDSGSADTIAAASTVVDDEMLQLKFAATASPTTPTGIYTVTATFVATGTF